MSFGQKNSNMKKFLGLLSLVWLWLATVTPLAAASIVRPVLVITSQTANLVVSIDTFTLTGTATGSTSVSNVFYSLNQATWTNAATTNSWTNWSATVTLLPGTNAFSACAVDTNGVHSLTNTVRFVYYLTSVLTVRTNGSGSIKPVYNGMSLQLGLNYSMTATAVGGGKKNYGFQRWTDGSSNIVSGSATLKFMMTSNLTLTANFGDVIKPTIRAISSTEYTNGIANFFVVHGTASDNVAVTNVLYQLNGGVWQAAWTTNHWTNWDAVVELNPGLNTFNAYAVDNDDNNSLLYLANLTYNSAPSSLSGKFANVTDTFGKNLFTFGFGKSTFNQSAQTSDSLNAVGSYTYTGLGGSGVLNVKFAAPPIAAARKSQSYQLTFLNTNTAIFITTQTIATNYTVVVTNNTVVTTNVISTNLVKTLTGYMGFGSVSNLAIGSKNIFGQLVWTVSGAGDARGLTFQKGKYTSQALLTGATNGGSYTYAQYSPFGALFKLTQTNGTTYVLARFADTNHGAYYEEDYDSAGHTNGTDQGSFFVDWPQPGGNAPLLLTNKSFEIFSGSDTFNQQFGADTFSQDTLSTNFDTDVGSYTYSRSGTNIGVLNLTVTAPPTLAGSNSAARLIFVNGSNGLFTNEDGTLSTFVMTSVTNLAPVSLANTTLNLTNNPYGFVVNQIGFLSDGNFTFNGTTNGFFTVTNYSPSGAMVSINFTDSSNVVNGVDWLQLNYKSAGSGTFFVNEFGTNNDFQDNVGGNFGLH